MAHISKKNIVMIGVIASRFARHGTLATNHVKIGPWVSTPHLFFGAKIGRLGRTHC